MADCNDLFLEFNDKMTLGDSKKDSLIKSRDSLRDKITSYVDEKDNIDNPTFQSQGSFELDTIVEPIPETIDEDLSLIHI